MLLFCERFFFFTVRNTFLIEYVGEIIDLREFKKRSEKYSDQNNEHFYFMSLKNDLFIDATRKGNISRYFNHSCDPNCETQKVKKPEFSLLMMKLFLFLSLSKIKTIY